MPRPSQSSHRWAADPATWAGALFLGNFLLQRISALPGLSISASTPLTLLVIGLGLVKGVLVIEPRRAQLFGWAVATTAVATLLQMRFHTALNISVPSWAFWLVIWVGIAVRFRDTSADTTRRVAAAIANVSCGISAVSLVFLGSQLAGLPYRDHLAAVVPSPYLVDGFVITYPITYGSPIYRSNGWLALEPSFLSFMLGIAVVCALVARVSVWRTALLLAGMLSTFAGSGLAVLAIAIVILPFTPEAAGLRRHLTVGLALLVASAFTPIGAYVFGRFGEVSQTNSSSSLRAVEPYAVLVPRWLADPPGVLFGYGAGSARLYIDDLGQPGLVVPNVAKMLFEYGLLAGLVLVAVIVVAHTRSAYPALGISVLVSFLVIQPASQPLVTCSLACITWCAPALRKRAPAPLPQDWPTDEHATMPMLSAPPHR
ncbi:MAG: hypothetical protein IPK37_02440 [Austwickia sp.]|jgi:hypothetical protein|nr:MAG: hypothetical protein IPK37_02440 [Austwickia sp.]